MGVYIKANSFFIFNYMFQQCYFKHNNNEVTLTLEGKQNFAILLPYSWLLKFWKKKRQNFGQKDTGTTIFNAVSRLNYQISTFLWQFTFSYSQNTD